MKVLIVEDEILFALEVTDLLERLGHQVVHVCDEPAASQVLKMQDFDVVVLDLALSNGSQGLDLLKMLRQTDDLTAVLIMSGKGSTKEKVEGLTAGANDYLAKPVFFEELVARIEALGRPSNSALSVTNLIAGDICINRLRRKVTRAGRMINLLPREYALLEYFVRHPYENISTDRILSEVWKVRPGLETTVVEVHLCHLRKKIDRPFGVPVLRTMRKNGFMFCPYTGTAYTEVLYPVQTNKLSFVVAAKKATDDRNFGDLPSAISALKVPLASWGVPGFKC